MTEFFTIVGLVLFVMGAIGLMRVYWYSYDNTEQLMLPIAAFVIGLLMAVISSSSMKEEDPEVVRWKIAHCYGPSNMTAFCVPSMKGDEIRE